jgi:ubiquitin-like modifier-activating enzyme ATG7
VAAIASALLVELLVSILQHPLGAQAPAPATPADRNEAPPRDPPEHALGIVPHQIRGFLADFRTMSIRGESYPCCSACSRPVLDAYRKDGWKFVKRALDERDYVTKLSGLWEVQRGAEELAAQVEWSEEEDAEGEEGEGVMI